MAKRFKVIRRGIFEADIKLLVEAISILPPLDFFLSFFPMSFVIQFEFNS